MPATPITAPASAGSTEQPSSAASMSATAARISSCRGRVAGEVALVEPHRADVEGVAGHDGAVGVAEDQLGGAAADVDDQQRLGQRRQVAGRAGEADPRLLVTVEHLGLHADALAHAGDELVGVLGVAGGRGRAEPDLADVVLEHDLHVLLDGGEHPLQRGIRDPAGAVDALARAARSAARGPASLLVPASTSRSAISSRSELVPQSKAATRVMSPPQRARSRTGRTATSRRARRAPRRRAGSRPDPGRGTGRPARAGT